MNLFHPVLAGESGLVSRRGDEAGPLVVGVVMPLIPHELVEHVA
jgi:hypothetical protein